MGRGVVVDGAGVVVEVGLVVAGGLIVSQVARYFTPSTTATTRYEVSGVESEYCRPVTVFETPWSQTTVLACSMSFHFTVAVPPTTVAEQFNSGATDAGFATVGNNTPPIAASARPAGTKILRRDRLPSVDGCVERAARDRIARE